MRFLIGLVLALAIMPANASVTVSVNGVNHTIPQTNEKGWGSNVTAWIQAISLNTLQPNGGTFTLTGEVNTGATYGFKVPYIKTATSNPSSVGVLRLGVSDSIGWRNNANGGNLLLAVDGSDNLTFNGSALVGATTGVFQDSTFRVYDNGDATKKLAFETSGITTGTTRTWTVPDFSDTLVGLSGTATLTNKTLTAPVISTIVNTGTLTLPTSTDTLVGRATTDTLTNKTLTSPVISSITNTGTLTLPTSTDTLVGKATTDVLTNKTISFASNTLTNVQPTSTLTAKGDLYVATASNTVARQAIGSDTQVLTADSAQTNGLKWATPATAPDQSYEISNCSLATSVSSNALTVTLTDKAGSTPSAGSPCKIGFRSATAATGTYTQVLVTAATTVVVSSGSTLGCLNTVACTLYVYAVNNAGTVVLAVGNSIQVDEGSVYTTTVLAGSGADDSPNIAYSTAAQSAKAIRLLGRITITETTAGTWASNATEVANVPFVPNEYSARYYGATASLSNGASADVTFSTKDWDPAGAVSGATFTAPATGLYHFTVRLAVSATWSSTQAQQIWAEKNGSATVNYGHWLSRTDAATSSSRNFLAADDVQMAKGDTLKIRVNIEGTTPTVVVDNNYNSFAIHRVR